MRLAIPRLRHLGGYFEMWYRTSLSGTYSQSLKATGTGEKRKIHVLAVDRPQRKDI